MVFKFRIIKTNEFETWLQVQSAKTRTLVTARLDLVTLGHFGNHKRFDHLIELKWLNGTRVYIFTWKPELIVVLYGGTKHAQTRDIKKAKKLRQKIISGAHSV